MHTSLAFHILACVYTKRAQSLPAGFDMHADKYAFQQCVFLVGLKRVSVSP